MLDLGDKLLSVLSKRITQYVCVYVCDMQHKVSSHNAIKHW